MNLHITWPIEDPHQTLAHIKTEALNDLHHTLTMHGLTRTGRPALRITHGQHPAIHARIPVQEPQ